MRIFNLFLSIVIALALVFVMLQNSVTIADVKVFQYSFTAQKLSYILLASFIVGILFGFVYMLYPYLKAKSDIYKMKKDYNSLYEELESLRTVSIDELPEDETDTTVTATSQDV